MQDYSPDFSVAVQGIKGFRPDIFSMDDVPGEERKAVARQAADQIIARLKKENHQERAISPRGMNVRHSVLL